MNLKSVLALSGKTKLIGGVAGAAAAGVVTLAATHRPASAQVPGATPTVTAAAAPKALAKDAKGGDAHGFLDRVAAQLHVGVDQLKAAITAAEKQAVQTRVASGNLTQAQADKLLAAIDKGGPALLPHILAHRAGGAAAKGPGERVPGAKGGHQIGEHVVGVVAKLTGLTPKDVMSQLHDAKSLAQIAQSKGVSESQLAAAITADVKQRLDAEVATGKVSADQEGKLLDAATKHLDKLLEHQPKPAKK